MTILTLFLTFFKIGLFTFGGGYAMVPLIRETVISNGWITEAQFLNFIAVSESTPGPLAVNMATFVGSEQAGVLGALAATLGVVLPSFIILLIIAAVFKNLLKYRGVNAFLSGVRPCVVALILSAAINLGLGTILGRSGSTFSPDIRCVAILAILAAVGYFGKKLRKKRLSPIFMIVISAGLGILFFGLA